MAFNFLKTGNQTNDFSNILQTKVSEIMMKISHKDQIKLSQVKCSLYHPVREFYSTVYQCSRKSNDKLFNSVTSLTPFPLFLRSLLFCVPPSLVFIIPITSYPYGSSLTKTRGAAVTSTYRGFTRCFKHIIL